MLGDTGANLLGALGGLWLVLTLSGTGQAGGARVLDRDHRLRRGPLNFRVRRTDAGPSLSRLPGQALMSSHSTDRHAQAPDKTRFIFVTGRCRLLARQGHRGVLARPPARRPRPERGAAEVRPLHQRRPGHDVALPARRGVRHRGRRRDRPRPRPLRALHRQPTPAGRPTSRRAGSTTPSSAASAAATTSGPPCRSSPTSRTRSSSGSR